MSKYVSKISISLELRFGTVYEILSRHFVYSPFDFGYFKGARKIRRWAFLMELKTKDIERPFVSTKLKIIEKGNLWIKNFF